MPLVLPLLACLALSGPLLIHAMTGTGFTADLDGLGLVLAFALADAFMRHGALLEGQALGLGEWLSPRYWADRRRA